MTITIGNLSKTLMQQLEIYTADVLDVINEAGDRISKEGAKTLRETSPKRTGTYAKGWTVAAQKHHRKPTTYTIHNKNKAWLVHLLENSHALRNGKRSNPIVHVAPVDEEVSRRYVEAVEEALGGG